MGNAVAINRRALDTRHYLRVANTFDYWFDLSQTKITRLQQQTNGQFYCVIFRDGTETDAYIIPFEVLANLLSTETLDAQKRRWIGSISNGILRIRGAMYRIPVQAYHNKIALLGYELEEDSKSADEITEASKYPEGAKTRISVNKYERSKKARQTCIDHYKPVCVVCGFDFGQFYGVAGQGYIHVHHLRQLSEVEEQYEVDPINDLRPVCANCHAIIHRREPHFEIAEVRDMITAAKRTASL